MPDQLEKRLRAEGPTVLSAVLDTANVRRGREPDHREATEALVGTILERFLGLLADSRPAGAGADAVMHEIGARFALSRVSHDQALYEFHRTLIEVSRRSWAVAGPSDVGVLLRLAQAFEREVEPSRVALSEGYCVAFAASGTRVMSRRQLAETLVAGRPVNRHLLLAANVTVAHHYLVLCTWAPASNRPMDDIAERLGTSGALVQRHENLLLVLMPAPRLAVDAPAELAANGFDRLAAATGATVAGASVADVGSVPDAVEEARAVFEIAAACERRGAVLAEDVLVERALTGSAAAMAELAEVIAVLARWPHLPLTMRTLYDNDLDRSRTAEALHIARRTLTKRLDRIHQLTGIHPTSALGVQTFMSALAADRLTRNRVDTSHTGTDLGVG